MRVFAYRAFCMRDRFEQPFPDIKSALNALFSDRAYMPESFGEIIAYTDTGDSVKIPRTLYVKETSRFDSRESASGWVMARQKEIKEGGSLFALSGMLIANPDDPVDKQISDALAYKDIELDRDKGIKRIALEISAWLKSEGFELPATERVEG